MGLQFGIFRPHPAYRVLLIYYRFMSTTTYFGSSLHFPVKRSLIEAAPMSLSLSGLMFPIHESICHPTLLMRPSAFCVHRLIHFLSSPFRTGESSNDDQTAGFELHLETTPRSGFVAQLDGRERNWMVSGTWSPFKGRAEIVSQLFRWIDGLMDHPSQTRGQIWSDG